MLCGLAIAPGLQEYTQGLSKHGNPPGKTQGDPELGASALITYHLPS